MLTASNTSKTAKTIKGDITYHHIAYVNVLLSNITFYDFFVCLPIAPTAVWARSLSYNVLSMHNKIAPSSL